MTVQYLQSIEKRHVINGYVYAQWNGINGATFGVYERTRCMDGGYILCGWRLKTKK